MITEKQVISFFPNLSDDPSLVRAQFPIVYVRFIKPFLGTEFYNEILTQYNTDTLTAANESFLREYLQPIIAYYTMFLSLPVRRAEPTASGISQYLPELGVSATPSQIGLTTNHIQSGAESLVKAAKDFLKENKDLYPLWKCTDKISNGFGLYLGDSNSQVYLDINR